MLFGLTRRRVPVGAASALRAGSSRADRRSRSSTTSCAAVFTSPLSSSYPSRSRLGQLLEDALDALLGGALAFDDELVALRADLDAEERLDVLEVGVVRAVERLEPVLRAGRSSSCGVMISGLQMQFPQLRRVTGDGAPDIRSTAAAVFGNAITSRIELSPPGSRRCGRGRARCRRAAACRTPAPRGRSRTAASPPPSLMFSSEKIRLCTPRRGFGCCRRRSRCRSAPGRRPWRAPSPGSVSSLAEVLVERRRERVMHRDVALLFGVPLEQREVHDPGERELVRRRAGRPSSRASAGAARAASTSRPARRPPRAAGRPLLDAGQRRARRAPRPRRAPS